MTKYYSNKPDFPGDPISPLLSSSSYYKSMSSIMDDIEAAGKVVTDEGVEDLYVQNGEASLGTTKDSTTFDKSLKRIFKMVSKTKKIHSDIMQNIDSKFTKGMDAAFVTLNDVNGANKPYKSKYTKKTVPKKVLAGYRSDNTAVYIDTTEQKSYNLVEILDGKASPIQAAKDVYDDRIKAVKEMMAKKDQLSDEQIKALEGKSAEEIVAVRYPGQLPDYQRLKASRYYEENKESLQYVDMALKVVAFLGMAGGAILAPATGGTSLTVSYASMAYLAADSAYSAFNGHTMITGNQLSTEDRVWAGIDAAVTLVSMGSVGYLAKLAKSGKNGSTVLKGLATAGKHADDVNDVSKVIYSFATDQDPNAALQNLVLGQVMGLGMNSAGNYIGKKFGAPAVDLPGAKASHLDVPLQGKQIPKLDPANVRLSSRPDLHLKASPADGTLAKLKPHPTVSVDVPKVKQVSGDSATKAIGGVKPGDVDVLKVKTVSDVEAPKYDIERIKENIKESRLARESSKFKQYAAKEYALAEEIRYKNYWNEPILKIPKGSRPDPKTYVNSEYLTKHFAEFDEGATVIQTEWAYTNYSEANGFVGVPDDNTLFAMPTKYADKVIQNSNGNINYIEEKLGFPKGYFKYGGGLVRIDIEDLSDLDLRLPSGNETGANSLWIPGGETSGGVPEAILNTVPLDKTRVSRIGIK